MEKSEEGRERKKTFSSVVFCFLAVASTFFSSVPDLLTVLEFFGFSSSEASSSPSSSHRTHKTQLGTKPKHSPEERATFRLFALGGSFSLGLSLLWSASSRLGRIRLLFLIREFSPHLTQNSPSVSKLKAEQSISSAPGERTKTITSTTDTQNIPLHQDSVP